MVLGTAASAREQAGRTARKMLVAVSHIIKYLPVALRELKTILDAIRTFF